jgi:hypothetical protein
LKAFHHIVASSAETMGAFNTVFDAVTLHRPAVYSLQLPAAGVGAAQRGTHQIVAAQVEFESKR